MKNPNSHVGTWGWVGLAAYVAAFDVLAPETMSHAADRALESPRMRLAAWTIGGIVVGHVFNLIPEQVDPFLILSPNYGTNTETEI